MTELLDAARLVAAICCTVAPFLLIYSNLPLRDPAGGRVWVLSRADWFLRFTMFGFVWANAYGLWEAIALGVPTGPRTWVIALVSVYLLIGATVLAVKRAAASRRRS